jgi:predicted RNA-binding protein YlqC (UPF0109 family)
MKEFMETVVRAIVDREDHVRLNVIESAATIIVELRVAKEDMGRVIGREGNMAWALRTLVLCFAAKGRKRGVLEILE